MRLSTIVNLIMTVISQHNDLLLHPTCPPRYTSPDASFYLSLAYALLTLVPQAWALLAVLRLPFYDLSRATVAQVKQLLFDQYNVGGVLGFLPLQRIIREARPLKNW